MKPRYVPAYDGLRFFLLLGVLEFHYLHQRLPIERFWFLSHSLSCFFVLSGFLISHLLLSSEEAPHASLGQRLRDFYVRRGLRILPAYFFVLAVAALSVGVPYLAWQVSYLLNIKLFLLSLEPAQIELNRYLLQWESNGAHLWSMGVEEQFYLLYPPALYLTPRRWRTAGLLLGIGLCIAIRCWLIATLPHSHYGNLLPVPGEYVLWGCLMAWLEVQGKASWLSSRPVFWGSGLALLALFWLDPDVGRYQYAQWRPPLHQTVYAVLLAIWVLALKHQGHSWVVRCLSYKPFTQLGKISYGAYLVHLYMNPLADSLFPQLPRAVSGPILSLAAAGLMWVTFEERANRAKDRWAP